MGEFDSPWKEAIDQFFEWFMAFFFPQAHADIDWLRGFEFLDTELQKIMPAAQTGRRSVDKLVKVWRRNGDEEWVLIHVEVQNQAEMDFPQRMYVYNYRVFDRYQRKVVSLAILGDDRPSWKPDNFGYSLWGSSVQLQFPVVKLLDYADSWESLEIQDNPFAWIVFAHLKSLETRDDAATRRAWKFRMVRALFERGMAAEEVRRLFRFIDWIMDLPEALAALFEQELAEYQEKKHMPYITSVERTGIRKGLLAGIKPLLRIKFGEPGLQLLPEIEQIHDHEKLEAILNAIETTANPAELRRLWDAESREP